MSFLRANPGLDAYGILPPCLLPFGKLGLFTGKRTISTPLCWQLAELQLLYMVAATCFG